MHTTLNNLYLKYGYNTPPAILNAGNLHKLGRNVLQYSITAVSTCRPTKNCLRDCYATQGRYVMDNVKTSLDYRLQLSKLPGWKEQVIEFLNTKGTARVRIHPSGDFYSREYVANWFRIMEKCPNIQFLAYSRRYDFLDILGTMNKLKNASIYYSLDDSTRKTHIEQAHAAGLTPARLFDTEEQLKNWNKLANPELFKCPGRCEPCSYKCWKSVPVAFIAHGQETLKRIKMQQLLTSPRS